MSFKDETAIVFVGNLSWQTNDSQLYDFCSGIGKVLSAEIKRYADTSRSKGWGLVEFENISTAKLAIELLDLQELGGRKVHVRFDRVPLDSTDDSNAVRVFIGNLAWDVSDEDLELHFNKYPPTICRVMTNMAGRSRGFGLLQYATIDEALRAIETYNQSEINGRKIQIRLDHGPGRISKLKENATSVFVRNLNLDVTDEVLTTLFSEYGQLVSAKVMVDSNGASKGWGVVTFALTENATNAINHLNGQIVFPYVAPLEVRFDRKSNK